MDSLDFVFTEETSTKTLSAGSGGYLAGVIVSGVDLHDLTATLTVKVLYTGLHDGGVGVTVHSASEPANGTYAPFKRMNNTAEADLSGAGEWTRFVIPSGSTIEISSSANLTADVTVVIEKA